MSVLLTLWSPTTQAQANMQPTSLTFFGLHIHRADTGTAWPTLPFGSWRLWDARVTWADIEPTAGNWDFTRLDRFVAMAQLTKVDPLLALANTPRWASARPDENSPYGPGRASEPLRTEDWRRYVRTVAERYKGRIHHYEIWNEPNIKHHYSGSVEKLVELACEAASILKSVDPLNQLVSPGMSAGAKDHFDYLDAFLAKGGAKCVDIVGHHFYVPNSAPESMIPLIRTVRAVMAKHGIADKPLWNTEAGWWLPNGDGTAEASYITRGGWKKLSLDGEAGDYVLRAFVIARAEGLDRFYWYSWDHDGGLGLTEPSTGKPKPIAAKWREATMLLTGATGVKCTNSGTVWQCTVSYASRPSTQVAWTAGNK
jgi:hypothetical protein